MPTTLKAITLFSGLGLAEVGLKQAGFEVVGAVEKSADIAEWHQINHPKCKTMVGSIEEFDYRQFDGIDLLHMSPPCQQYSLARNPSLPRHEGADAGLLALKAIDQTFPKFITLENVPGYLKADAYRQIKQYFWTLGYWLNEEILDASDYGIPQIRRRLISRWIRGDALARDEVPISHTAEDLFGGKYWYSPSPKKQSTKKGWYSAIADLLPSLPETELAPWQIQRLEKNNHLESLGLLIGDQDGMIRKADNPTFTVCTKGPPQAILFRRVGQRGKDLDIFLPEKPAPTIKALGHKEQWQQLDGWDGLRVVKITPKALARFQTIPDSFQLPKSNVLACIGIGNGVPCELMRQIAATLLSPVNLTDKTAPVTPVTIKVHPRWTTDDWRTPDEENQPVVTLVRQALGGTIGLDPTADNERLIPAERHITKADNCLQLDWESLSGTVFMNPPYSNPLPFLEKLIEQIDRGNVREAIVLLPLRCIGNQGTGKIIEEQAKAQCVWKRNGRLAFLGEDGSPRKKADFISCLIYFGDMEHRFTETFQEYGVISYFKNKPIFVPAMPITENNSTSGLAISFGHTCDRLLAGMKTVTRRQWQDSHVRKFSKAYREGKKVRAIDKDFRYGGKQIGWLRLTEAPYLESLAKITARDCTAEGYPELSPVAFKAKFFDGKDEAVWVINFEFEQTALPEVQPPQPLVITGTEEVRNPLQRSQLNKKGLCDYVINVASGCLHGCTFCYVPSTPVIRFRQEHLQNKGIENPQHDWGKYLFVREAIAEQLEAVLANKRTWQETPAGQGVVMLCSGTDPYQNNRTAAITRSCVEVLLKYGKRVRILTRSPLWTQDLDILVNPLVTVGMSLPHLDDRLSRQIEPNAPRPSDRYRALQKGAVAGCRLFVAMAPTPPHMGLSEFQKHLSKLMAIDPEVIFWEPINARSTNGLRMLEAGLEFAKDISNTQTWADNFIRQWQDLEAAASSTRCQELLHIWPDRALSGHVSENELESWWSRPTKEKWPSQQPTQVNQLDILETPKTMLAIETTEEYNLSEDIDIDFERESPPGRIFQFPTSPIAEPYTPQEPEPLTRPLIEEKIVALTDEVKDLEEQARIRREEISQLHQQAKTCLKSEFITKLKALREIIEGDRYGLTDYFCDELNRLHVELCPSSGCKKTIEETEQPLNTEEAEESDSDREYIPYQGDYPEVVALSNWERENQLSSPEEESSIEQAKNTKTPSLPQDREQDGENWSLEKTGEKNNYCTNFNSHEDNAQPPVRTIPELEKVRSHDPVESKPDQKLSFDDIQIQDGEKWYFEKMPNKTSSYCANFKIGDSDAEFPEILTMRLTDRSQKRLEQGCNWVIAEGLALSYTLLSSESSIKKLSTPKIRKAEANITLKYPDTLEILVKQIASKNFPASRKWAGEVGQLFFPGDRVRRRELNTDKQWEERDYIVSSAKHTKGTKTPSGIGIPPMTGYTLICPQTGKSRFAMPGIKMGTFTDERTGPLELIKSAPDFGNAYKVEPYQGMKVGDRVTVEAVPNENGQAIPFKEWAGYGEDEWVKDIALKIAAFLDDGRIALSMNLKIVGPQIALGTSDDTIVIVPSTVVKPLSSDRHLSEEPHEQEPLAKTFNFPDVSTARAWEDWFTKIIGKALSEKVKVLRSKCSKEVQLNNLTDDELAILNNLELPETIPTPAAAREMWATAVTDATNNNITTEIENEYPN